MKIFKFLIFIINETLNNKVSLWDLNSKVDDWEGLLWADI